MIFRYKIMITEIEGDIIKTYIIKDITNSIDVEEGTIRQCEKDFELDIPRKKENARYFTEIEIETLEHIKTMREKNLSKAVIKELLDRTEVDPDANQIQTTPDVPQLKQSEVTETLRNIQKAFETLPEVKEQIVSELKEEIKNDIRDELNEGYKQQNKNIKNEFKKIQKDQQLLEQKQEEQNKNEKKKDILSRLVKK